MKRVRIFGAGLVLSLALPGCDLGPAGPSELLDPGTISFGYTGGLPDLLQGGSFGVDGAPLLDARGRPDVAEWAVAASHPLQPELVPVGSKLAVIGFAPGGAGRGALFVLTLPRVSAPATVRISEGCAEVDCGQGLILLGVDPRQPHRGVEGSCGIAEGELQITSVGEGRIRGTFSGRGQCARDWRGGARFDLTIDRGQFDVPVAETFRSGLQIWS